MSRRLLFFLLLPILTQLSIGDDSADNKDTNYECYFCDGIEDCKNSLDKTTMCHNMSCMKRYNRTAKAVSARVLYPHV